MFLPVYLQGMGLGGGLIMAIGGQNAYVLRTALKKQHVSLTVLVCIICDMALIAAGVAGMGALIEKTPILMKFAKYGGALFLFWYGLNAWKAAFKNDSLDASAPIKAIGVKEALATVLAITLLNPHVYLDTVVLLGSIGGQHGGIAKWWFALGSMTASCLWFISLGYGARLLAPLFAKPIAWRILDVIVGTVMWGLAISLVV
ncbi:LysE/ArgO family amino acid transporter [Leeia sp. TBRC 13508]|uniref:LysE/ArgO family amino acid transporter n=1 Tax=Leeia speluncae TaxID=2884804 RepID=A0ABS8D959_9NEIS|nr:LysE/ArgO family amino acid transporter [Leeia speluncae]MCB6184756.1 LysE/ArgO family amino acid transporter [Leeia speluncae]